MSGRARSMKKEILVVSAALTLIICFCSFAADEEAKGADPQTYTMPNGSIYSYSQDNLPEVFFFPKEKSRWDGTKVTMSEWYMLTELQKEKFITEYLQQLQGQYKMSIDVAGIDYLRALNTFSSYSNDKTLREPSTKFIDILLSGQGKVPEKDRPKNGGQ